jgi:hypothetical protein
MSISVTDIDFNAPPTCARFMRSEAFFRLIAGPVGSGKTTACIFELLRRAMQQAPAADGLRHTRFAIVRQTLKQLKDTVLKDIEQWLKGLVAYKVSDNTVYVSFADVRSEWLLIPLDDPEDQRRLLSMQLTGAWLSEAIEMNTDIVQPVLGRCGRYPGMGMKPKDHDARGVGQWPTWFGAIADTNMPSEGSDWHKFMELETPPDWQIFKQPGGMEPDAENLQNLPGGRLYYERQARGHSPEWIQRYVHAQYGPDPSGSAVFRTTFNRRFHTVSLTKEEREGNEGRAKYALNPTQGFPLIVTQDFGRNPSSLICQIDHKGRGLVLQEVLGEDVGLQLHVQQNLIPVLKSERYFSYPVYVIGDPTGRTKNSSYEETSFDLLKSSGLQAFPAPTNAIDRRLKAVENMLLQQRDGGPALIIDADMCPTLVMALSGRYRFAKRRNGQLAPLPEKLHPWSDLADDLQYFCLVIQGGMQDYIANRLSRGRVTDITNSRPRMPARAWT